MKLIGFSLLVLNVACTAWSISLENWFMLPVNFVGIYFALDIIGKSR